MGGEGKGKGKGGWVRESDGSESEREEGREGMKAQEGREGRERGNCAPGKLFFPLESRSPD